MKIKYVETKLPNYNFSIVMVDAHDFDSNQSAIWKTVTGKIKSPIFLVTRRYFIDENKEELIWVTEPNYEVPHTIKLMFEDIISPEGDGLDIQPWVDI